MSYYILAVERSKDAKTPIWWGRGCCGYTDTLNLAGIYCDEDVENDREYFDNRYSTIAMKTDAVHAVTTTNIQFASIAHLLVEADAALEALRKVGT